MEAIKNSLALNGQETTGSLTDKTQRLGRTHNLPPDPLDEVIAIYADAISEAENWLDGEKVENEGQMKAVDVLLKQIRSANRDLAKAEKLATAPLHDAWKAEIAKWKPTKDDLARIKKGLADLVGDFKVKLSAEKAEAQRLANLEAAKKRRAAELAAQAAETSNLEAQRKADALKSVYEAAEKAAKAAKKDTVKGLRTVTKYEITDHRTALLWIAANDKDAVTEFIEEYVRRNHKDRPIEGVRVWQEKEAF